MNEPTDRFLKKPLVSVIIPTYNRAKIIITSIKSVLNQTYKNIEVIVIDDGSTDNTEEAVRAIEDSRIIYIRHQNNRGGAAARNTGIDAAKGEYIAFLDSDDAWVANKLELQLTEIKKHLHPEKTVSYTQVFHSLSGISEDTYCAFDEKFVIPKRGIQVNETISEYLFCHNGKTLSSTLLMHRSLAVATRFREDFKKHQDWDFSLRLEANSATFSFIEKPLAIWNGDPKLMHVGRNYDYRLSENWFHECKQYISSKAATAFLLKKILPSLINEKQRKLYAQKLIFKALIQRAISFKRFGKLSSQIWL